MVFKIFVNQKQYISPRDSWKFHHYYHHRHHHQHLITITWMFGSDTIFAAITSLFQSSLFASIPRANSILTMRKFEISKQYFPILLAAQDRISSDDARLTSSSSNAHQRCLVAHPLVQWQSLEKSSLVVKDMIVGHLLDPLVHGDGKHPLLHLVMLGCRQVRLVRQRDLSKKI